MNDLARRDLKGPVNTLHSEFADWDSDTKSWKVPRHSSMTHFRPDGQISEVESQSAGGSVYRSSKDYDDVGKLRGSHYRTDGGPETTDIYHYDDLGRLIRVTSIDQNSVRRDSAIYDYDQTGRKTAKIFLPVEVGSGATSFAVGMGESDETAETVWYDIEQHFVRRVTFARDATGRLLKEEVRADDAGILGGLASASSEEREKMKDMLTAFLGPDRVFAATSYVYDALGRKVERRTQMSKAVDNRTTYEYDDRGNPVEEATVSMQREMHVNGDGTQKLGGETSRTSRVHYDYQYDSYGNWTERIVSSRLEGSSTLLPASIERHAISYYASS